MGKEQKSPEMEEIISPLERVRRARERLDTLGKLVESISEIAKLEILTRFAEKYPTNKFTYKIADFLERVAKQVEMDKGDVKEPMLGNIKGEAAALYDDLPIVDTKMQRELENPQSPPSEDPSKV